MKLRRDIFQAIADPTRRTILVLLTTQSLTAGEIASNFEYARPTISKHIQILSECDLVKPNPKGREIYYELHVDKLKEIDQWLTQFRKQWVDKHDKLDILLTKIKNEKMENENKTTFVVDKENNTLTIKRNFDANRNLVWDCYTKSEFLEQWFAPEPFTAKTKEMDFKEGGYWLYAMIDPKGTEYWSRTDFTEIKPIDYYKSLDGFCNENGELNADMPRAKWIVNFTDLGEKTNVESVVTYNSLKDLEMVLEMGIEEGIASTHERLDKILNKIGK